MIAIIFQLKIQIVRSWFGRCWAQLCNEERIIAIVSGAVESDFCKFAVLWRDSYQIRKIAVCACAENAGNFPPPPTSKKTASKRSRHASRHVRHTRAVMHVGIANPRWWVKRSRHSRRMRDQQFHVSGKRPMKMHKRRGCCNRHATSLFTQSSYVSFAKAFGDIVYNDRGVKVIVLFS